MLLLDWIPILPTMTKFNLFLDFDLFLDLAKAKNESKNRNSQGIDPRNPRSSALTSLFKIVMASSFTSKVN